MGTYKSGTAGVQAMLDWLLAGNTPPAMESLLRDNLAFVSFERNSTGETIALVMKTEFAANKFEKYIPLFSAKLIKGYAEQGGIKVTEILVCYE